MNKLRKSTLVFLINKSEGNITDICLAMKKRGFGVNRWNGVGGKVDDQKETVEEAAKRETKEEINVSVKDLKKVAELSFYFPHNPAWDQIVHVYLTESWDGDPKESEEMRPEWFLLKKYSFKKIGVECQFWVLKIFEGP